MDIKSAFIELVDTLKAAIPIGKENAIHQEELARRLGVNTAAAKTMVRQARQQGVPILSANCGYWFAENEYEKKAFVTSMEKSAISRLKSAKGVNNAADSSNAQMSLFQALTEDIKGGEIVGQEETK